MHRELAFAFHHIKGVAEIFHSAHIRHYGLFLVDSMIFCKSKRAAMRVKESITRFIENVLYLKVNKEKTFHIGKMIITYPPTYVFFQFLPSLGISPPIAATCQFSQS